MGNPLASYVAVVCQVPTLDPSYQAHNDWKRKPTETHQHPDLVPLAPMVVAVLWKPKEYHGRERVRKNAEYGGTWNGECGGWPRGHIRTRT
jgi:hypothetical protein